MTMACFLFEAPVGTALIGFTGVILGIIASYFTGLWADKRRWKREDSTRYLADRRSTYATFFGEVTKAAHLIPSNTNGPALAPLWAAMAAVELIGSSATISAAQALLRHTEDAVQLNARQTFDSAFARKQKDCMTSMQNDLESS